MEPTPVFQKKRGISPIWILPAIALCICVWIVYTSYQTAGITVTVYFEDATGITPGKTQVIIRGIPIGTVNHIEPDLDNRRIKSLISIDKSAEDLLVEDTRFWVVRPEISAASVQGLDTILSGSYIGFQPGISADRATSFIGLSSPPPIPQETPGLHIKLRAEQLGSIQTGSEVYYRNLTIGSVTKHSLALDNSSVIISLFIKPEYTHLVREGSRFCNASGVTISGKLTNLKVQVESLASFLKGGIVLHTPAELEHTDIAKNGRIFPLYKDLEAARYGIHMTLQLASSRGITEGETKLIFRGLVAGVVQKIDFNDDEKNSVTAHIMLDPRAERILRQGTQFWLVRPEISLDKIDNLDILLSGSYITFIPGSGTFQNDFEILPSPPPQKPLRPGTELLLTSTQSYSLKRGAPVKFKDIKVGEILDITLDNHFKNFEIPVFIYQEYEHLIRPDSVFWNDSGFSFDVSLSGIHLKTDSLRASFSGGISFITPEKEDKRLTESTAGVEFMVYESYAAAVQNATQLQPVGYSFQLRTDNPETIKTGTPIYYKKIEVGKVTGFRLAQDNHTVLIDCFIDQKYADTVNSSSRFYDVSGVSFHGGLSSFSIETESLQSIMSGGISYFTPKTAASPRKDAVFPLYNSKIDAEKIDRVPISIRFKKCDDLRHGSLVRYKGMVIGSVTDLHFDENMEDILVDVHIEKDAEPFFRSNTMVWLENVEVGLSGIKNLKTVLFGSFINILPGKGELERNFTALTEPPSMPAYSSIGGLRLVLTSKHLGSLKINSPVYYRQVKIGKVVTHNLSADFKNVYIFIDIDEAYRPIIRENTKFWFVSGTKIEGSLFSGVSVSTESLEALLSGGIAMATPENSQMGEPVQDNHQFTLHEEADKEWLDWQPEIVLVDKDENNGNN
jgi:paraquat-inducible protein B